MTDTPHGARPGNDHLRSAIRRGAPPPDPPPRPRAGEAPGEIVQEFVTSQLQAPDDAPPPPGGWLSEQLQRLQRLLALRDAHASNLNSEGRRLLDHAIFTTFVDCRDLGGEARASALLTPVLLTTSEVNATAALPASDGDGPGTDAPAAPGATESSPRD